MAYGSAGRTLPSGNAELADAPVAAALSAFSYGAQARLRAPCQRESARVALSRREVPPGRVRPSEPCVGALSRGDREQTECVRKAALDELIQHRVGTERTGESTRVPGFQGRPCVPIS